jgi:hypothetical protein
MDVGRYLVELHLKEGRKPVQNSRKACQESGSSLDTCLGATELEVASPGRVMRLGSRSQNATQEPNSYIK